MKKNSFLWAALSMTAALVMTACSNDDNDMTEAPVASSTSKTIPYTVTVGSGDATTRATVKDDPEDRQLYFATGDKLYITGTNIQGVLDLQAGDEGKASGATFSGDLTYSGEGSPAADLQLTATLVSAQQTVGTQVSVDAAGAVTVNYPTTAYCADVATAVQKYSNLTGTSTYGARAFTLTQQTAFLNFEITVTGGTPNGTLLPARFINNGATFALDNVTTVIDGGLKAKFVLPVAIGTALSSATLKLGGIEIGTAIGNATLSSGKVYNVKRTVDMSSVTLANTLNTADMTVKVNYDYWDEDSYCLFVSNGNGTYTFQSSSGYGPNYWAKALVVEVGKLVFKQNAWDDIDYSWDDWGYSVTFDTSDDTYSQWAGGDAKTHYNPSFISVEVNGKPIEVTSADPVETTVTWTSSDMPADFYADFDGGTYNNTHQGITVTASGSANGGWSQNNINVNDGSGTITFTSSVGNIKSIVITADNINIDEYAAPAGWTINSSWEDPRTLSWSGTASTTVNLPLSDGQNFSDISTIVFTLE